LSGNPEDLLRGALEKIVFFECRLSQLEAELKAAREVAVREKESAAAAREREVQLETQLAQVRGDHATARAAEADLAERVQLLERERERFLTGLIDRARIAAAPGASGDGAPLFEDGPDLAGFIAELRGEIERLKPWKAAAEKAGIHLDGADERTLRDLRAQTPQSFEALAAGFEGAGRIGLKGADAHRMKEQLPSRAERSLYEASMDDLDSADAGARRRAADCLRALASPAAAPLLAASLGRERDPDVKTALLAALAAIAEPAAADLAARELADPHPPVRAAALEAVAVLAKDAAEPRLAAALADPSALVRRRAVLLLGFVPGPGADDALASALSDRDPGVARAAAVALSGRPTSRAQAALAKAIDHREAGVRRSAAEAVSRWAGESVDAAAPSAERRRAARRIAERLVAVDQRTLRDAVVESAAQVERIQAAAAPPAAVARAEAAAAASAPPSAQAPTVAAPGRPLPAPAVAAPTGTAPAMVAPAPAAAAASAPALAAVAVLDAVPAGDPVEEQVVAEVRTALRGRTIPELAAVIPAGPAAVEAAARALVARGVFAQRGPRFFMS
jgi:HEAT repeat protein